MAGRIRTIKPELLDDEKTAGLSHEAWRLFVSLLIVADDHGRFRANIAQLRGAVFWAQPADTDKAMAELELVGLVKPYKVRGQAYGVVSGWSKHQKVDKPSKPRCPGPDEADCEREFTREGLDTDLRPPTSIPISDRLPPTGDPLPTIVGDDARQILDRIRTVPSPELVDRLVSVADKHLAVVAAPMGTKAIVSAILDDPSLRVSVVNPAQLVVDLLIARPDVDAVAEVQAAGAWLRAHPDKPRPNGNAFLQGWFRRARVRSPDEDDDSDAHNTGPPPPIAPAGTRVTGAPKPRGDTDA